MENGAKTASSRSPSTARRIWRWSWRLAATALLLVVLFHAWIFARIWRLRAHNPQSTAFMQQGLERLHEKNPEAQLRHHWVDYERISTHLKRAVIAAEDQKFLDHEGFDWNEMEKAYDANQKGGRIRRRRVARRHRSESAFLRSPPHHALHRTPRRHPLETIPVDQGAVANPGARNIL